MEFKDRFKGRTSFLNKHGPNSIGDNLSNPIKLGDRSNSMSPVNMRSESKMVA